MSQTHPLNANGKLIRRFYEPLVLLAVLDPARGAHRPDLIADRGVDGPTKLWRNFLDQLSWLCDWEAGGDTVTSIAAQRTVEHPVFWIASNSKSTYEARDFLVWLFGRLSIFYSTDRSSVTQVVEEIRTRCTKKSAPRIKNYTTWLLQAIASAKDLVDTSVSLEDKQLLQELQKFESLASDPPQLCALAHKFRRHESMQILSRRHTAHLSRSIWSDIRHYIGRLGCWTKAVQILCLGARTFPQRIENARFEVVEPFELVDQPNKNHLTDLSGVMKRMLSPCETNLLQELSEALTEINAVANIEERFREDYACIKPRPHAELLILEHFYQNQLEFVEDDRYIGCSKPSCFTCDLYMKVHPGNFTPRSCHGNLWINWAPPIPLPVMATNQTSGERPQEHHSFKMMQKMLDPIRQAVQQQILSRRPRGRKLPDSTTGISSIALTLDLLGSVQYLNSNAEAADARIETSLSESDTPNAYSQPQVVQHVRVTDHLGPVHALSAMEQIGSDFDVEEEDDDVLLFRGRRF